MAQASSSPGGLGRRARRSVRVLARRAGLSPVAKAGVAGIALVAVLAAIACIRLLPGQPGGSFVIERGEGAATAEPARVEAPSQGEGDDASAREDVEAPPVMVVHVDGMVASPGVYRLQGDSLRMDDAVKAAGGLVDGADTSRVNLAEPLSDGEKVHVPAVGEEDADEGAATAGAAPTGGATSTAEGIVNINTATAAELTALPGVGDATAAEIVRDREANGAFASVEDLMRVSGIGEKKFAKLKGKIRV